MPQAVDITVKNGASTPVDKTFSLVSPAAGDGSLATWALKEGLISSVFPAFSAMAVKTGVKSRKLTLRLSFPSSFTDAVTGQVVVGPIALATVTMSIPDSFPESMKSDLVAYTANLINASVVKAALRDAYSFT